MYGRSGKRIEPSHASRRNANWTGGAAAIQQRQYKLKQHIILRIGATHSCARPEISTAHSDRSLFLLANNVGGVFSVANSRFASIQLAAINIKLLRSSVMWLVAARVWWCARRQNFDRRRVCGQVLLAARGPISHIN